MLAAITWAARLAALEARGTTDRPVVLTGMQETRGSWQGVWVHLSRINFQNLHIYWGGDPAARSSSGLHLDGGFDTMHINGLHVEGSGSCGITVDEMAFSLLETFDKSRSGTTLLITAVLRLPGQRRHCTCMHSRKSVTAGPHFSELGGRPPLERNLQVTAGRW